MRVVLGCLLLWFTFGTAWSVAFKIIEGNDATTFKSFLCGFGISTALAVFIAMLNLAYDLIEH